MIPDSPSMLVSCFILSKLYLQTGQATNWKNDMMTRLPRKEDNRRAVVLVVPLSKPVRSKSGAISPIPNCLVSIFLDLIPRCLISRLLFLLLLSYAGVCASSIFDIFLGSTSVILLPFPFQIFVNEAWIII